MTSPTLNPKKNNIDLPEQTATIENLSHDARGIAHIDGKVIFIANALPGETVKFKTLRRKSKFNEGEATEILETSSERQTPPCEYFGYCGGCQLQHMTPATQLAFKQHTVLEHIQHIGKTTPQTLLAPLQAETIGYRHKARLSSRVVKNKDQPLLGFRESNGRFIADHQHCEILAPRLSNLIAPLRQLLSKLTGNRDIPQIEMAAGNNNMAIIIRHVNNISEADKILWIAFSEQHQVDIYLQSGGPDTIHLFYPLNKTERLSFQFASWPIEWLFHPTDFTQIHPGINEKMLQQALTLLAPQPTDHILDLFCGLGNFTLPFALSSKHVTGVEGSERMVLRAQENAKHNNIDNVDFHVADLEKPINHFSWAQQPYQKIIIDPPRCGAAALMPFIGNSNASHLLYISCQPTTLARDTAQLVHEHGYTLQSLGIMDMFPHTHHVETMALFTR